MRGRLSDGGLFSGAGSSLLNCDPAFGELIIGSGTAWTSASNPSSEVIDLAGTVDMVNGRAFGVTQTVATGLLTIQRVGDYLVELDLQDFSCGAALGNVQFDVQKSAAAFATTQRMQGIQLALTTKGQFRLRKVQSLVVGDTIRAIVTSAAGNVVTITEGVLRVTQLNDGTSGLTA